MRLFGISGLVLAKLATPALVVALSPIPIVVALVLLVHNDRPQSSSLAYLLGRMISLTALTAAFMRVPRLVDDLNGPAPAWTDWMVMGAGVAVIALGAWLWWRGARTAVPSEWEGRVGGITPTAAASIGMLPMLANPKVLAASAAAGTQIGSVRLTAAGSAVAIGCYAALASSTVAAPILAYVVVGSRIDPHLERIRGWIQARRHALTAMMLVIVGVAVLLYGFS